MLNPGKDKKEGKDAGSLSRASHFLEEVNEKGERGMSGFGEFEAFNAEIKYGYSIKTSPELKDFPLHSRRGSTLERKRGDKNGKEKS